MLDNQSFLPEGKDTPNDKRVVELEDALADHDAKLRAAVALYDKAKREFPEAKARIEREAQKDLRTWQNGFLARFTEVLDEVDRALESTAGPDVDPALRRGLELIAGKFAAQLLEEGVEKMPPADRFDPRLHEAVATQPVTDPRLDGAIVQVVLAGYRRGEDVLRPAKVVVGTLVEGA